jgi:hypothetical protein
LPGRHGGRQAGDAVADHNDIELMGVATHRRRLARR